MPLAVKKFGFTLEVDLHGMMVSEARRELERLLNTADKNVTEIVVIHGYSGGQALQTLVRKDLRHRRIRQRILSMNPGVTSLMIQP